MDKRTIHESKTYEKDARRNTLNNNTQQAEKMHRCSVVSSGKVDAWQDGQKDTIYD